MNFPGWILSAIALALSSLAASPYRVPAEKTDALAIINEADFFEPGDVVLFERGGVWRGTLKLPEGLTLGAYGDGPLPIISGAEPVLELRQNGPVWTAAFPKNPVQVFIDAVRGQRMPDARSIEEPGQWFWDRDRGLLTIGDTGQRKPNVEASVRDVCIDTNAQNGVEIRDLHIERAGFVGVLADESSRLTIQDCEIAGHYINGIRSSSAKQRTDVFIRANHVSDCGGMGIGFGGRLANFIVEDNHVIACGVLTEHVEPFGDGREAAFQWTGGIKIWGWGGEAWQDFYAIRNNSVRHCLPVAWAPHPASRHGHGIWSDEVLKPTKRPQIHGNRVDNCFSRGVYLEKTDDHDAYGNIVTGCAQIRFTGAIEAQSNPYGYDVEKDQADPNAPRQVSGNRIFHNTVIGGWWVFSVSCSSANCSISASEVLNNIFIGERPARGSLYFHGGGANDGTHGSGNAYRNNSFGQFGSWVWAGNVYRDVAELEAASDAAISRTVHGRPVFVDAATGNFRLSDKSPGKNAASDGSDLGAYWTKP